MQNTLKLHENVLVLPTITAYSKADETNRIMRTFQHISARAADALTEIAGNPVAYQYIVQPN